MFGFLTYTSRFRIPLDRPKVGLLLASLCSLVFSLPSTASENLVGKGQSIQELTKTDTELSIMMHILIGEVSYQRGESFNAADEAILTEALNTAPYLGRFFQKMEEACSYYRSPPPNSIDALTLAKIHAEAQRVELVDRISFLEATFSRLSSETQSLVPELAQRREFERARTIQAPYSVTARAESDAEGYLREFEPVCERVESMRKNIESGAGIAGETRFGPEGLQQ